jgi:hypothetical protein
MRHNDINFETLAQRYGEPIAAFVFKEIEKAERLSAKLIRPSGARATSYSA